MLWLVPGELWPVSGTAANSGDPSHTHPTKGLTDLLQSPQVDSSRP